MDAELEEAGKNISKKTIKQLLFAPYGPLEDWSEA